LNEADCHPLQLFLDLLAGELTSEGQLLDWLSHQVHSDEIEDVTDEMLDMLIAEKAHLAVLFCE
jgi:hypothetical protein